MTPVRELQFFNVRHWASWKSESAKFPLCVWWGWKEGVELDPYLSNGLLV